MKWLGYIEINPKTLNIFINSIRTQKSGLRVKQESGSLVYLSGDE